MLTISSRIKFSNWSLEKLLLIICVTLPMIIFALLSSEHYVGIAIVLGMMLLLATVHNYRYGFYFIIIGLPLFQSLTLKSDSATATGINLQYILIPVVFVAWLSEKVSRKELSSIKLPYFSLFTLFVVALLLSLVNQLDIVSPKLMRNGFISVYALVNYLILFYIIVNEKLDFKEIQKILWGFLIVAFITAVIGIYQYFTAEATLITGGVRATSTFKAFLRTNTKANPNAFGTYMAFMIALAILIWNITTKKNRIYILFVIGTILFSLILSFSRSSLLAIIFVILCYTFWRSKKAFIVALMTAIIGLIALYFEPTSHRRIESIFTVIMDRRVINMFLSINPQTLDWSFIEYYGIEGYNSDIISGAFRIWAWIQGINLFLAHPVVGVGYHLTSAYSPWPTAENLYLDFASMTGIFGFTFFLIIQIIFLRDGFTLLKSRHTSDFGMFWLNILAITFVASLTGSILFNGKLMGIFWILAGLFYNVKFKENDYLYQ